VSEFITLEKKDARFASYLLGSFSRDYRAIPVRSLHINSSAEQVTFQVVPNSELQRPNLLKILVQVGRLDLLSLTLMPPLVVWALFGFTSEAILALVSLFFLHAAFFARNDYVDHVRGVDRLNEKGGSRVIQRGWLRAMTVRRCFYGFAVSSILSALPILNNHPALAATSLFAGLFGAYGYSHLRWSRSGWLLGGLSLFMCLGPLLALGGFELSLRVLAVNSHLIGMEFLPILIGVVFGLLAVIYVETRHLISLVVDDEADLQTLPVRFGFDRAKVILAFLAVATAGLFFLLGFCLFHFLGLAMALPMSLLILQLGHGIYKVNSPLSSALPRWLDRAIQLHFAMGLLLILLCRF
jgi:1,4-dihydroxy-2-naphthoate octaprenyltransferase